MRKKQDRVGIRYSEPEKAAVSSAPVQPVREPPIPFSSVLDNDEAIKTRRLRTIASNALRLRLNGHHMWKVFGTKFEQTYEDFQFFVKWVPGADTTYDIPASSMPDGRAFSVQTALANYLSPENVMAICNDIILYLKSDSTPAFNGLEYDIVQRTVRDIRMYVQKFIDLTDRPTMLKYRDELLRLAAVIGAIIDNKRPDNFDHHFDMLS